MKKLLFLFFVFLSMTFVAKLDAYTFNSEDDYVYLGGETVGLKLDTGVTVTKTYAISDGVKLIKPWDEAHLAVGDVITNYDDKTIKESSDLLKAIEDSLGRKTNITYVRNQKSINATITPYTKNNTYSLGIYIKDNILGVGTLTYILKDNNYFGALGHQIEGVSCNSGHVYDAKVSGIRKSVSGEAGSKIASIGQKELGLISKNSITGIHGIYQANLNDHKLVQIKKREEINLGKAEIITCIDGYNVESFEILITSLQKQKEKNIKGITFKVTDERLIGKTGGIVQGMSGSPIIQDGKLIGAVTHVIVNSPLDGYGIYIEFMFQEMDINVV